MDRGSRRSNQMASPNDSLASGPSSSAGPRYRVTVCRPSVAGGSIRMFLGDSVLRARDRSVAQAKTLRCSAALTPRAVEWTRPRRCMDKLLIQRHFSGTDSDRVSFSMFTRACSVAVRWDRLCREPFTASDAAVEGAAVGPYRSRPGRRNGRNHENGDGLPDLLVGSSERLGEDGKTGAVYVLDTRHGRAVGARARGQGAGAMLSAPLALRDAL